MVSSCFDFPIDTKFAFHIIPHCLFVASFVADESRTDTVRSFVRVSVPVFVPKGNAEAMNTAKSVVRNAFAKAISAGKFDGF